MEIVKLYESLRIDDPTQFPDDPESAWGIVDLGDAEETSFEFEDVDTIEAQVGNITTFTGDTVVGIYWNIPAGPRRGLSPLLLNGNKFNPKGMSFTITNIYWKAGGGWPWYTVPQPRSDRRSDMLFPGSPVHSIIAYVGCKRWQVPVTSGHATGTGNCQTAWGVNDQPHLYGDNSGGYRLWLNGYW